MFSKQYQLSSIRSPTPIRVYPIVHWLKGQGLSLRLQVSIRRGKNDFIILMCVQSSSKALLIDLTNFCLTSFKGTIKFFDFTLSCSSLEIFLVAGFSRTIFKVELELLLMLDVGTKADGENPEAHPTTIAIVAGKNFIL